MDISILICTWNNSERLSITLESLKQCIIPKGIEWEIILVNNSCTDATDAIVSKYRTTFPIKYIKEERQGVSKARNTGLKHASGQLIIFTDDDIKPTADWIFAYWDAYKRSTEGYFFGGPVESEFESMNFDKELLEYAPCSVKGFKLNSRRILNCEEYFIGANWACPRSYVIRIGGVDESKGLNSATKKVLVGEESDMMDKLNDIGIKGFYIPEARIKHFVPLSKCSLRHIANRIEAGCYIASIKELLKFKGNLIFGIPRWMYKGIFLSYLKWIFAKCLLKKGIKEYITFRGLLGEVRRAYELMLSSNK